VSFALSWRQDRRGASAIEFALALPLLLAFLGGMADLGLIWRARGRLAEAVDAGCQYAVMTGSTVTAAAVQTAMCAAAATISSSCGVTTTPAPTVVVAATAPTSGCISIASGVSTLTAAAYGTTCAAGRTAGGPTAGSFMNMSATYTYTPVMPLYSKLLATTFTERAWARLQ
jgi:Flp pilus assembly protein TadG